MNLKSFDKAYFSAIFQNACCGVVICDIGNIILMTNSYIEQQLGYEKEELDGVNISKLIPYISNNSIFESLKNNYSSNSNIDQLPIEVTGIQKKGAEIPLEINMGIAQSGEEYLLITYINNISQRKETEKVLEQLNSEMEQIANDRSQSLSLIIERLGDQIRETQRKEAALQRANNYLTNVWNYAGAVIFVYDVNGLIQFLNPAAEKALGYTSAELIGIHTPMIFHIPEDLVAHAEEYSKLLNRKVRPDFDVLIASTMLNMAHDQEWQYIKKDGSSFFVSLSITQLKDLNNNVTGYLGIAIDITEKKKSEIELLTALRKEKELNELKSRFVSMASHEFRTPLSGVLSSAYLLSRYMKAEEQPQRDKHIQNIVSSVTSLTEILNDFLSVGKIEEGNINPHFAEFDAKESIEKIIKEVQHLLKENQTIDYKHAGTETTMYLDPSMLKHIIRNLLSNAIKFSTDESVIEVYSERTGNLFILSVKDYGIGIPESEHGNLFNIFFRSSYATNIQGTGLGLHIVKKYVEMMGGSIDFKSAIGQGAEFTIKFHSKNKLI